MYKPKLCVILRRLKMDFITLRDFAENKGVTYEAIRRQVAKYETELRGHVVVRDRTKFLDEYAQDFLSERRRLSPVVVKVEDAREDVEELERAVESLRAQLLKAQNELLAAKDMIIALKDEKEAMIESKVKYSALLEEKEGLQIRLEESEAKASSVSKELEDLRTESGARDAENKEKIEQISKEVDELRVKADMAEENRKKLEEAERERDEARKEAASFERSWFGFYRKK